MIDSENKDESGSKLKVKKTLEYNSQSSGQGSELTFINSSQKLDLQQQIIQ